MSELKKILPSAGVPYKISFDEKLALMAKDMLNQLAKDGLIYNTHSLNDIPYRWQYGQKDVEKRDIFKYPLFQKIVDYIGIRTGEIRELKFEITSPNEFLDKTHLNHSRVKCIITKHGKHPFRTPPGKQNIWGTLMWHIDDYGRGADLEKDTHRILVYLNDVDTNSGPICIADPIIYGSDMEFMKTHNIQYKVDDIKTKEIVGQMGTIMCFRNATVLHRASLPKKGYRYNMQILFKTYCDECGQKIKNKKA